MPKVNCTIVRKSVTNIAREEPDFTREDEVNLARHLDHGISTSDKVYSVAKGLKVSALCGALLCSMYNLSADRIGYETDSETSEDELEETGQQQPDPQEARPSGSKGFAKEPTSLDLVKLIFRDYIQKLRANPIMSFSVAKMEVSPRMFCEITFLTLPPGQDFRGDTPD